MIITLIIAAAFLTGVWYHRPHKRILIRARSLSDKDLARIFGDWPSDDPRLAAILQCIQEHLDNAQGDVASFRADPAQLAAAAGGTHYLEALLSDLVSRLRQ